MTDNRGTLTELETASDRRRRFWSLRIIYFTMFLMTLGFSIILTGVWPFLEELDPSAGKEFLGLIIAANPLGQMIFSPLFGYWANKASSIRLPFIVSLLIFCAASLLYSTLEFVDDNVKYWMLVSRFFVGASGANVVICRSYVSAATKFDERTRAVSILTLAQTLGFIFGPLIQGVFTPLGNKGFLLFDTFHVNMYTAPGWSNVILGLLNVFLFLPFVFQDKRVAAKENMLMQGKTSEKEAWKSFKPDKLVCWALIFSLFVFVFNFVLLESLGTPLTMENFAWNSAEALEYMAYIMGVGGVLASAMFFFISPLTKIIKESHLLIYGGFGLMVLGRIAHIPYGERQLKIAELRNVSHFYDETDERYLGCPTTQEWCHNTPALGIVEFFAGYLLTSLGYPIGLTLIQTIFSKVIGPRPQGMWQSLLTQSGCISRILGPLFVSFVYTKYGTLWLSVTTGLMMIIPITWLILLNGRLDVKNESSKEVEMEIITEKNSEMVKNNEMGSLLTTS